MPFLALVHLRDLPCGHCSNLIASAGARSFIVDAHGNPLYFAAADPPAELGVELTCPTGHCIELNVPNEIAAEESLSVPEEAEIGRDARLLSGVTEAGTPLP